MQAVKTAASNCDQVWTSCGQTRGLGAIAGTSTWAWNAALRFAALRLLPAARPSTRMCLATTPSGPAHITCCLSKVEC